MTYVNWRIKQPVFVNTALVNWKYLFINATGVNSGYREAVLIAAAKNTSYWMNRDLSDGG